ncbi:MAG: hypothetical protein AAGD11_07085 [Planctomycetota bacterium]
MQADLRQRATRVSTALALSVLIAISLATCQRAHAQVVVDAESSLTASMRPEFGAATWVPHDAGFFSGGYRYGEQWEAFKNSQAFQELAAMPGVTMAMTALRQQSYVAQFQVAREQNPLIDQAVNVLFDAFGDEVFVYVDRKGPGFVDAVSEIYGAFYWIALRGAVAERVSGQPGSSEAQMAMDITTHVLARRDDLRLPGVVFGFRLNDPNLAQDLINEVKPLLQQVVPFPLQQESIGNGNYLNLELRAEMFMTPDRRNELAAELQQSIFDPQLVEELIKFIESQSVSISIGMRGDYLLISIGADTSHLGELGKGESLAECEALAPVRKHFQKNLVGLTYVDAALSGTGKIDVASWTDALEELSFDYQEYLPNGMAGRLLADVEQLLLEVNDHLPHAAPTVSASYWNRGYESFRFSALAPGSLDSSQLLTVLDHSGPAPMWAIAGKSPPSLPNYKRASYWMELTFGYIEECIRHFVSAEEQVDFDKFKAIALPVIQDMHETTRDMLIPSLDGGQTLFVVDAEGAVTLSPQDGSRLPAPIKFPRPAMLFEVHDPDLLVAACNQYRTIFNNLMSDISAENPEVVEVHWPAPDSYRVGNGRAYTYAIPPEYAVAEYLNDDFAPHALLTDEYLVLALSTKQSEAMLQKNPFSDAKFLDHRQPSARIVWFDWSMFTKLLFDDTDAVLALLGSQQRVAPATAMLIKVHADKLRNAMSAIRTYCSRTYEEDGRQVTHSHLYLQDYEP